MANWDKLDSRGEVDDRRGVSRGLVSGGIGTLVLMMGVTYLLGGNPLSVLLQADPSVFSKGVNQEEIAKFEGLDDYEVFVSTVLGSNNDYWSEEFSELGKTYSAPTLVLFREQTTSACGGASGAVGPHYCPSDGTIYLDETFFEELQSRFAAKGGDVAEAYVIAHEVGHHVQTLLGTIDDRQSNEASIKTELQADCFAGLWAGTLKDEEVFALGEINEAIDAAAAVGDDNIQKKTGGTIQPESWTHGSSKERVNAFTLGYEGGELVRCLDI
jgi:uncharacterized protein